MITFIATVHILACISLIALVLMQDSKGGGGVFSTQSSSNSVLGASGATSLAGTLTKVVSAVLVASCIGLAMLSSKSQKSVIDSGVVLPAQQTQPVNGAAAVPAASSSTETKTESAAPAPQTK